MLCNLSRIADRAARSRKRSFGQNYANTPHRKISLMTRAMKMELSLQIASSNFGPDKHADSSAIVQAVN